MSSPYPYLDAIANTSATITKTPKMFVHQFGDGYAQLQKNGINNNLEDLQVHFIRTSKEEMDALEAWFDARAGMPFHFVLIPDDRGKYQIPGAFVANQDASLPVPPCYRAESYTRTVTNKYEHVLDVRMKEFQI